MPIYYRADTRSPEEIFKNGFKPRSPLWGVTKADVLNDHTLLKKGIEQKFYATSVSEACSNAVVCMTTNFNSAPIFPVDVATAGSIYVYAIYLPENEVFDLYKYQVGELEKLLSNGTNTNSGYAGVGLCGYEAFSLEIESKAILGAVKCERSALKPQTAGLGVYATHNYKKYMIPFDRDFKVASQLFTNSAFYVENFAETNKIEESFFASITEKLNKNYTTTSVADAVIAAGFEPPKSEYLFMVNLRGGYIRAAISSIFASISEGLKSLASTILNCFRKTTRDAEQPAIVVLNVCRDADNVVGQSESSCLEPDRAEVLYGYNTESAQGANGIKSCLKPKGSPAKNLQVAFKQNLVQRYVIT